MSKNQTRLDILHQESPKGLSPRQHHVNLVRLVLLILVICIGFIAHLYGKFNVSQILPTLQIIQKLHDRVITLHVHAASV